MRTIVSLAILFVIGIGCIVAYDNRYAFYDWWRLRDYNPPPQVQQLAKQDTMTPYATHLFYVYHPQIENSSQFNQNCSVTTQAIVLGCTVVNQGIYLYNVTDPQLYGVMQVTAAYEMLHVGYSRLSDSERARIDKLVLQAYKQASATDPQLVKEEQSYLKTEGQGAVANELHSMMGTEVANLPPELEHYYDQYFYNRQVIVKYEQQYQNVFLSRQNQVQADEAELVTLKQQITSDEADLNSKQASLTTQRTQLQAEESSGNIAAYNAGVPSYNAAVDAYNAEVGQVKSLINQYNEIVAQVQQIEVQENSLIQAISSYPTTIQ